MARSKPRAPYVPPTITEAGLALSPGLASMLLEWASDDPFRSMLCGLGIGVANGQPYLCATDGHRLVRVPIAGSGLPCRINAVWSADKVTRAIRLAKVDGTPTVTLAWSDVESGAMFPPVDQVVPQPKIDGDAKPCAVNPAYLTDAGRIGAALAKLTDDDGNVVAVIRTLSGALEPMRIDILRSGYTLATLVIMPMRADVPHACVYEAPVAAKPTTTSKIKQAA